LVELPTPSSVIWDRDPHTAAKHQILKGYLDAWFPIIASRWKSTGLTYVDAFAGPGEYTDGSFGSPIIAARAAFMSQVTQHGANVNLVFIEKNRDRFDHLGSLFDKQKLSQRSVVRVHGDCETALVPVLDELKAWAGPMFVNFDGWGVDTPYTLVRRVGEGTSPEVLVTFHSQWFTRFAGQEDVDAGDRVYGDGGWRAVRDQPDAQAKKSFLVSEYRRCLNTGGFCHCLTFELVDEGGHPLFLVYGTTSLQGVRKMKDAMWRVDRLSGSRFRDPRDPNQLQFDVDQTNPNLTVLRHQILERLEQGPTTLANLKNFVLRETVFKESHTTIAVDELVRERKVLRTLGRGHARVNVRLAPPTLF
jgi:three-Cys-motif partner protein